MPNLHRGTVRPLRRHWLSFLALLTGILLIVLALVLGQQTVAQDLPDPTPLPLYALPDARTTRTYSSNSIAFAEDIRTMVVANMVNDTATLLIPADGTILSEIPVGDDPRTVALTPDNNRALVTNLGDNSLSVIDIREQTVLTTIDLGGASPYGVITNVNDRAYVSLRDSNEVVIVDLPTQAVTARIAVPPAPTGLAIWGDFLYVTHLWSGDVSMIYVPQARVVTTVSTGSTTGMSQSIDIDITRGVAYVPQTRTNEQDPDPTYDTLLFPVVNAVELNALTALPRSRINLDTADRPVNMPFAIAVDRFREWIYVANAGSNNVSVIDLDNGQVRSNIDVGANPRGILLNRDNTLLFVHNTLDATVITLETENFQVLDVLPVSNLTIPADLLIGAQLFHSAADERLSAGSWVSCANCHFDGLSDGRTWLGFDDGPRNTPLLYGATETAPYNWSATWDELADVELKIRALQAGTGLIDGEVSEALNGDPHTGISPDLDTLVTYLTALEAPTIPLDFPTEQVERGAVVFEERGCSDCHVGAVMTNMQRYDVGTGLSPLENAGTEFDTPSLRWLWLSAPYFHDGSAATLEAVFSLPGTHQLVFDIPPTDLDALITYLLTLE